MRSEALFINGVFESVLEEILRVQSVLLRSRSSFFNPIRRARSSHFTFLRQVLKTRCGSFSLLQRTWLECTMLPKSSVGTTNARSRQLNGKPWSESLTRFNRVRAACTICLCRRRARVSIFFTSGVSEDLIHRLVSRGWLRPSVVARYRRTVRWREGGLMCGRNPFESSGAEALAR